MPQKDLRPKASSHFPPAAPLRTSSTGGPQQAGAKGRCAGWRNPQQWLMLAMSLLAMFIFAVRFYQSRHVRAPAPLPDRSPFASPSVLSAVPQGRGALIDLYKLFRIARQRMDS